MPTTGAGLLGDATWIGRAGDAGKAAMTPSQEQEALLQEQVAAQQGQSGVRSLCPSAALPFWGPALPGPALDHPCSLEHLRCGLPRVHFTSLLCSLFQSLRLLCPSQPCVRPAMMSLGQGSS